MTDEATELDIPGVLDDIRTELSGLRAESRNLNGVLDRLHAENERLRHAEARQSTQPALRELIKLADDWRSRAVAFTEKPELAQLCAEVIDDVTMILDRQGVVEFDAQPESEFDRHEHRAVGTRTTDRVDFDGRVAQVRRPGYRDSDRVIRFAEVVVYKFVNTIG